MSNHNLGTNKDVEALVRAMRRKGWTVEVDGNNHLRWQAPHGVTFRTPLTGNHRALATVRARIRKAERTHTKETHA